MNTHLSADSLLIRNFSRRPSLRLALVTETYPPEVNGVAMTLGRMVNGLVARGHDVQLIRPSQGSHDQPLNGAPAVPNGLGSGTCRHYAETLVRGLPIPRYKHLRFGLPAKSRLIQLWKNARPDLVHVATEGPLGWSAVAAARYLKLPVTSDFHTNFDHYSQHYGMGWLRRPLATYLRQFHNRTAATFVPTARMAQDLTQAGYHNLHVLARGVDNALYHPGRRDLALRQAWGIPEQGLAVLHVGRLAPEKNFPLLQRAFAAIEQQHPGARLILVGDGPLASSLQRDHPEYRFCGIRIGQDLAQHYASADMFLFPSLTETFGNVTLEAMASGLPVVAYRHAAAAEIIQSGVNGLLANPEDEADFIRQAGTLAMDADLRARIGIAARVRTVPIDWEHIYDQQADAFLDIVRQHYRRQTQGERFIQLLPD